MISNTLKKTQGDIEIAHQIIGDSLKRDPEKALISLAIAYMIADNDYRHDICDSIDLYIQHDAAPHSFGALRHYLQFMNSKISEWENSTLDNAYAISATIKKEKSTGANESKAASIHQTLERYLQSGNLTDLARGLVELSQSGEDSDWSLQFCKMISHHKSLDIAMLGITCIGHIARTSDQFDPSEAIEFLTKRSAESPELEGVISDALGDIKIFHKNRIQNGY